MLLKLSTEHYEHLSFLNTIEPDVASEFASISLKFLHSGINRKMFKSASQKLQVEVEQVENCIIGLMQLFVEATKNKLSDVDFCDSLIVHGFTPDLSSALKDLYSEHAKATGSRLGANAPKLPRYKNMEWRLDVKLASRSLHNQLEPSVQLKLAIENFAGTETKLVKADVPTLLHMISELEGALTENKSKHVQRFVRNIS